MRLRKVQRMSGSNAQYPQQSGAYAVKVKNGAGWRDFDVARFQISVGQPYHEGDKLEASLAWAGHRFGRIHVCVNDTLQRYNHMHQNGLSENQAFDLCRKHGDGWIIRNQSLLSSSPNVEIHRWEDWRNRPDYQTAHSQIRALFDQNPEFRGAVDQSVRAFWNRRRKNNSLADATKFAEFYRYSRDYLLEEAAVFSLMFEDQAAADIYPGTLLLPCEIFKGRHVPGVPAGLTKGTHNTRIDFRRQTVAVESQPTARVA